jgi:hypothetical protein
VSAPELEDVRADLRRLGYLSGRFDRFLLQDALKPRRPGRAAAVLTVRVALLGGGALAAAFAVALAVVNGNLEASPFDLAVLFVHLLPWSVLAAGLAFLALAGLLVLVLTLYPVRRIESLSVAVALVAGVALAVAAVVRLGPALSGSGALHLALAVLLGAALVGTVVKVVHAGLLSLAIRLTRTPPTERALSRRWAAAAGLAAALLLAVPALLAARPGLPAVVPSLPSAPGERVLLVGVDGVRPAELEYLLARGELPALRRLLAGGGLLLAYRRPEGPPASFWTTVATGLPAGEHGVVAVDSYRPVGVETPLARSGSLRLLWRAETALGLAEHRPLLANRRTALAVWELAARGGQPVAAVGWWATYPAEPLPGLVVAHGAWQLLAEGVERAVAPEGRRDELASLAREVAGEEVDGVVAALPSAEARLLADRALLPDRFYRRASLAALAGDLGPPPRAAAVYLPGPDIAADLWRGSELAFADLVREELATTDAFLARALAVHDPGTVAVVVDPGRRAGGGGAGRVVLWRRAGCRPDGETGAGGAAAAALDPAAIASGLLAALGLPASAELPAPPAACPWPAPPARLPTYGRRLEPARPARGAGEYLESLRSLGYL